MKQRSKIIGGTMALVGLVTGLIAGWAMAAWIMMRSSSSSSHANRLDSPPAPAPRKSKHIDEPMVRPLAVNESLSPKPKTRVLQFGVVMLVVALIATAGGLAGSIYETDNQHKKMAAAMTGGDPDQGKIAAQAYGCSSCHTIPGIHGANGRVGPPLNMIGERSFVGGVVANTPDNMIHWIQNAPSIDPKTAMPNVGVTEHDARDIAAYLYTLR